MEKEYKTEIYFAWKHFAMLSLVTFPGILIAYILVAYVKSRWGFGLLIFVVLFAVVTQFNNKSVKKIFTRKVTLKFDKLSFGLSIFDFKNNVIARQLLFRWEDIKSYQISFSEDNYKYTILTIYFYRGWRKTFRFADNKSFKEALDNESAFSLFHTYLKQFNSENAEGKKIKLMPGFYATKLGLLYLCFVGILAVILIFLLIKHPEKRELSTIGITMMGLSFYVKHLLRRKDDKDWYNTISKLDN